MVSKDYIIGLVDGEGSFTVYLRDSGKYREAECHFYIKLREEELPLLKKVQKFLACGYIALQRDKRAKHSDCYRYEVGNLKDLQKRITPFFKDKLESSSRRKDFDIFCKMVKLVSKKKHLTEKGWKKLQELKKEMHK